MIIHYKSSFKNLNLKTGDFVKVFFFRSRKQKHKRGRLSFETKIERGYQKRWKAKIFFLRCYRFWRLTSVFGRVGWLSFSNNLSVMGVYSKKNKHFVTSLFCLGAPNLLKILIIRQARNVRRKYLGFVEKARTEKMSRLFPLRRVRRAKHKVK